MNIKIKKEKTANTASQEKEPLQNKIKEKTAVIMAEIYCSYKSYRTTFHTMMEKTKNSCRNLKTVAQKNCISLHFSHKGTEKQVHIKRYHAYIASVVALSLVSFGVYTTVSYHQTQQQLLQSQTKLAQERNSNHSLSQQTEQLQVEKEEYMQNIEQIQEKAAQLETKMAELEAQKTELSNQLTDLAAADTASADTCLSILENGTSQEKSFTNIVTTSYHQTETLASQLDKMNAILDETGASFTSVASDVTYTLSQQSSIPEGFPTSGYVSTEFNPDGDSSISDGRTHKGIDIATGHRIIPIKATASGTVVESKYSNSYGNVVKIDHGNGFTTLYAHNSENLVQVGDTVTKGQEIAMAGSTGMSTGIHCHYEIQLNGVYQNPRDYQ